MEPIAVGFMIMIAGAALIGVVVGAIGGAVVWRVRWNLALGGLLTTCALLLVLVAEEGRHLYWLRAKLTWGIPSMAMAFFVASLSARLLEARTTLHPTWTALAAFAFALSLGLLNLMLFGVSLRAPILGAVGAGVGVILLLLRNRKPVRE